MLCIYCKEREADAREHYLPQCLGRFQNFEPLLNKLCQKCNVDISALEREFCRRSPEAIVRSVNWIKGQTRDSKRTRKSPNVYQPEKIGGRHLYMYGLDPETGRDILWQTDPKKPGAVKEISQFIVFDDQGQQAKHLPIPTTIRTGHELEQLFRLEGVNFSEAKLLVITSSGDEDRVQAMCNELNLKVHLEKRKGGRVPRQFFKCQLSPAYFRALAKIGFHYALRYIPTITGHEGVFRALRDFIKDGIGDHHQFLTEWKAAFNPDGPPGHILTTVANPNKPIVVNMQFFAGCEAPLPQWRLVLGDNPTALYVEQTSAHFFSYTREEGGRLTGGKVVVMSVAVDHGV
ncbi:MAG TPA: hypothetical protein VJN43_05615 [Bryobacteraceae bacterium]|nr:hypothetical protein [Bryobacteraceae bacterium]